MATYVLIPGAGGQAWFWHRVERLLRAGGHDVVAVDLPAGDDTAGFDEYTETVLAAIGERTDNLVVVGQSMGGFTAPLVCDRTPAKLLVLLNAMVPCPGESGGDWWAVTGHEQAQAEWAATHGWDLDDMFETMFHDVPADLRDEAMRLGEPQQSGTPFEKAWPLAAWPDVPTRVVVSRDDRFFPLPFQHRVVRERLGITPDEIDGGHLVALSRPGAVVERLEAYRAGQHVP